MKKGVELCSISRQTNVEQSRAPITTTASGSGHEQIDLHCLCLFLISLCRPHGIWNFADRQCVKVFSREPRTRRRLLMLCPLAGSVFCHDTLLAQPITAPTTLPIEIMGAEGSMAAVTIEIPQASAGQVSSLWLQIHGPEYPDPASLRVNESVHELQRQRARSRVEETTWYSRTRSAK